MANNIAAQRKLLSEGHYQRMHGVLKKNYMAYSNTEIDRDVLIAALMKDKKNTATKLVLIFPLGDEANIERVEIDADDRFLKQCGQFLAGMPA